MTCALVVIAKAPVAGRCKTRLTPPCTPHDAALLARAALHDTLDAVAAAPAARRVCVLDGEPGDWLPDGFEVIPQRGDGLDERLAHAFGDVGEPALLIGMDTPQVTPALLEAAAGRLDMLDVDAVLGAAPDGGYWALGLRREDPALLRGVPMSTPETCAGQRARLRAYGLRVAELPPLRDVDDIDDARAVARLAPGRRFARALARVEERLA
jgi:rSAM/selenodomain-associated transferase 1